MLRDKVNFNPKIKLQLSRNGVYLLGAGRPDLGVPALPGLGIDRRGVGRPLLAGDEPLTWGCFNPLTLGDEGRPN